MIDILVRGIPVIGVILVMQRELAAVMVMGRVRAVASIFSGGYRHPFGAGTLRESSLLMNMEVVAYALVGEGRVKGMRQRP
jgi:hypothetical protein